MKRLFLVLASMASIASTFAQDVIVKRDGEEIQCRILEVSTNKVKYKQWKNQSGPTFVEKRADVLMLKYENGQKEVISYSGPVSPSQVEDAVAAVPVDSVALADTMPISNDYLEYVRKEKSGLLMWGRSISEEKAHSILGKDWTDFTRAHKTERFSRAMIFTGGVFMVGGGLWTAQHVWAVNDYKDKKSAYENHLAQAGADYSAKVSSLYNSYAQAEAQRVSAVDAHESAFTKFKTAESNFKLAEKSNNNGDMSPNDWKLAQETYNAELEAWEKIDGDYKILEDNATSAHEAYENYYVVNGNENYNTYFYNSTFKTEMDDAEHYKKATLYPMIGCYASGAALLVVGIIKERRAHKKVLDIVNKYNSEDVVNPEDIQIETGWKPEFDIDAKGNGLAFLMKF